MLKNIYIYKTLFCIRRSMAVANVIIAALNYAL